MIFSIFFISLVPSYHCVGTTVVTFLVTSHFLLKITGDSSIVQVTADIHKSLDNFALGLAKAIESDAKMQLFGESTPIPSSLLMARHVQRGPRYLNGQRLRMESIDEGIVKDNEQDDEEDLHDDSAVAPSTTL